MRINAQDTIAIMVDYQERLIPAMREGSAVVTSARKLVEGLDVLGIPVYFTQQYTKGLGETVPELKEVIANTSYIEKIEFSAYSEIKSLLQDKKYVILGGVEAHICVLQTLIDLKEQGYTPILVTDCIDSRKQLDYTIALERAKQEGAILTTYESILFELLQKAGTDISKKIQKIIK